MRTSPIDVEVTTLIHDVRVMDVDVRELQQHLSEYLRRVADGSTVTVTDRGVPIALLTGTTGGDTAARADEEGWVRLPLAAHRVGGSVRERASSSVLDVLAGDRGG